MQISPTVATRTSARDDMRCAIVASDTAYDTYCGYINWVGSDPIIADYLNDTRNVANYDATLAMWRYNYATRIGC